MTMGTSTTATGTVFTLNVAPNFNYNLSNCQAVAYLQASPFTSVNLQGVPSLSTAGLGQQIAFAVSGNTALVASGVYNIVYNGCSQN
jgi:hypothetical protein